MLQCTFVMPSAIPMDLKREAPQLNPLRVFVLGPGSGGVGSSVMGAGDARMCQASIE